MNTELDFNMIVPFILLGFLNGILVNNIPILKYLFIFILGGICESKYQSTSKIIMKLSKYLSKINVFLQEKSKEHFNRKLNNLYECSTAVKKYIQNKSEEFKTSLYRNISIETEDDDNLNTQSDTENLEKSAINELVESNDEINSNINQNTKIINNDEESLKIFIIEKKEDLVKEFPNASNNMILDLLKETWNKLSVEERSNYKSKKYSYLNSENCNNSELEKFVDDVLQGSETSTTILKCNSKGDLVSIIEDQVDLTKSKDSEPIKILEDNIETTETIKQAKNESKEYTLEEINLLESNEISETLLNSVGVNHNYNLRHRTTQEFSI